MGPRLTSLGYSHLRQKLYRKKYWWLTALHHRLTMAIPLASIYSSGSTSWEKST